MKKDKYIVKYITQDNDLCSVWVYADNEEDAEEQAYSEHWDIKEIINIKEMRR